MPFAIPLSFAVFCVIPQFHTSQNSLIFLQVSLGIVCSNAIFCFVSSFCPKRKAYISVRFLEQKEYHA